MLTDTVRQTILAALEYQRERTIRHREVDPTAVDEQVAEIDAARAAIAAVEQHPPAQEAFQSRMPSGRWEPIPIAGIIHVQGDGYPTLYETGEEIRFCRWIEEKE